MSVEPELTTRQDRERARRERSRRSIVISTVSTVVVLGALDRAARHQPGLAQRPHDVLLVVGVSAIRSATCCDGFWLDVRMFLVVEVVVLVLGLVIALIRTSQAPGAISIAAARDGVGRRAARRADDPRRVPRRLRGPGARDQGPADRRGRARRGGARDVVLRLCGRGLPRRASSRSTRARRAAALALGPDPAPGDAPGGAAAGGAARHSAAAQRLHLAPEGRRARLDPRRRPEAFRVAQVFAASASSTTRR